MKLYIIHCGFYAKEIFDGINEFHVNIPVIAGDVDEAKQKVRLVPQFIDKKMHIDGIQELESVDGYSISFEKKENDEATPVQSISYRN